MSRPRIIEFHGERKTIRNWAEATGISRHTLKTRLSVGWSVERTLTEPSTPPVKHGEAAATAEYQAWVDMKTRCVNPDSPSYAGYGGRGIVVCGEWLNDYAAFLAHVGRRPSRQHSIDRIDNNRGYEPGNVRWATKREQTRNLRTNTRVQLNGRTRLLIELAEEYGVGIGTLRARLRARCPIDLALSVPALPRSVRGRLQRLPNVTEKLKAALAEAKKKA